MQLKTKKKSSALNKIDDKLSFDLVTGEGQCDFILTCQILSCSNAYIYTKYESRLKIN